jgi:predicted acylesterase/phospholipase RssA
MNAPVKLRVLLPGGGVKGAFQLGFLTEVLAHRSQGDAKTYTIDAVYGTSVGALMAPFIANEDMATLKEVFDNIRTIGDVVNYRSVMGIPVTAPPLVAMYSLFKLGGYQSIKLVDTLASRLTDEQRQVAEQKCHVVAYDMLRDQERWFTGSELIQGVRCSSALWLAVPPVNYDGTYFSDGGVTEIYPIDYIIEHELQDPTFDGLYVFVDCETRVPSPAPTLPTNGLVMMNNLHSAASARLANFELQKLSDKLGGKLVIVRPDTNLLHGALDVDHGRMTDTYEAGREKGRAFLDRSKSEPVPSSH